MQNEVRWLLQEKYNGEKTEGFFADCKRLEYGEPLAYVIGFIPFLDTKIFLDSHPLIPRTETEFWVEKAIKTIESDPNQKGSPSRVLDLCAGSGCIGVAILKHTPNTVVDLVEIDQVHHSTISKNILENGIDLSRTRIYGGNLFEKITHTYDYILSNPPYVDPVIDRTEESVKKYEPKNALYGGTNGMELIITIIKQTPEHLSKNGILYLEHEPEQIQSIKKLATQTGMNSEFFSDQFGIIRYTKLNQK